MSDAVAREKFKFSSQVHSRTDWWVQRAFEVLPGMLFWVLIGGMVYLSYANPLAAIVCIIAFDLFWLFYMAHHLILILTSLWMIKIENGTDWMKRIQSLPNPCELKKKADSEGILASLNRRASEAVHRRDLAKVSGEIDSLPDVESIYHAIIVSISDDNADTVAENVESFFGQDFPVGRIKVFLAVHEGENRSTKEIAWKLHREYSDRSMSIYVAPHSAPGRGAVLNYAARMAVEAFTQNGIDPSQVILTCLTANAIASPGFLSNLTWNYLIKPDRSRTCFQAIPVYRDTLWNAPGYASILHIGSSFFFRCEATSPHDLVDFASYSANLSVVAEIGYWPEDEHLAEDSGLFWKAFLHYGGNFRVEPLTTPLQIEAGMDESFLKTIRRLFQHQKMKARSINNLPIIVRGLLDCAGISRLDKIRCPFEILIKHLISATWLVMLFGVGWLPGVFADHGKEASSLGYFAPRIHAVIFCLAFAGLTGAAVISLLQLPKRPADYPIKHYIGHVLSWILLPFFALALTSFPSLVVQTRMMLQGMKNVFFAKKSAPDQNINNPD